MGLEFLEKEKPVRAEVKGYMGAPALFINGKPEEPTIYGMTAGMMDISDKRIQGLVRSFRDAGVHLYTFYSYIRDSMPREGALDYAFIDRQLEGILSVDKDAYILIRAHLEPPDWWTEKYPGEMVGYAATTEKPVLHTDDCGVAKRASFASARWLEDTTASFRSYIQHVESSQCGKRVIGYHTAFGVYGEWHYWGFGNLPDTGPAMTAKFRKWAREKYKGDISGLRKAWVDDKVYFDTVFVPNKEERLATRDGLFRDPAEGRKAIDYYKCQNEITRDDFLHFCKVVKEESAGKLAGGFYGYYFFMPESLKTEGAHLCFNDALDSPYVDFFCSPYSYELDSRKSLGDGLLRCIPHSIKLHNKLLISEMDSPTYRGDTFGRDLALWGSDTVEGSIAVMRRDFCNVFTLGAGGWWFDHGGSSPKFNGWWNEPLLMAEIRKMKEIAGANFGQDRSSVAQVLAVCDLETFYYAACALSGKDNLTFSALDGVCHALYRSGAAFDTILHNDLGRIDASKYKAYVFLNAFCLTSAEKKVIEDKVKKNNSVLFWVYAPGYIDENGLSVDSISGLTGIKIRKSDKGLAGRIRIAGPDLSGAGPILKGVTGNEKELVFGIGDSVEPVFYADDKDAVVLGRVDGTDMPGLCVKKFPGWTSVYCSFPPLSPALLRAVFKFAGAHIYSEEGDVIYANRHFLCVNSEKGGRKVISLPQKCDVTDLFDSKPAGRGTDRIEIEVPPKEIKMYRLDTLQISNCKL